MLQRLNKRAVAALQAEAHPYDVRDTELKGFLVRVEAGGTKSFFLDYRLKGRRNRFRLGVFPNLSADGAREIATAISGDIARGIDPQARKKADRIQATRDSVSTLKAFLDKQYEPWATAHLKSAKAQLERIRSDFADDLNAPLQSFNRFKIEGFRQKWKKSGMKPGSINRDIQRLRSVLSRAVDLEVLDKHPMAGVKPLKVDKTGRVRFLSPDEQKALRKALESREGRLIEARIRFNTWRIARHFKPLPERQGELLDHLKPMVLVALNTGLRRGELLSLKWADVNLPGKMLTVVAAAAKSGHTRHIPLNAEAVSVLEGWRERSNGSGLVFPGAEGKRMTNINRSWHGVAKAAKLKDFKFHDLRHTFASNLVQAGIDLNTVRELMGHQDIVMTLRYAHLAPSGLKKAVDSI